MSSKETYCSYNENEVVRNGPLFVWRKQHEDGHRATVHDVCVIFYLLVVRQLCGFFFFFLAEVDFFGEFRIFNVSDHGKRAEWIGTIGLFRGYPLMQN